MKHIVSLGMTWQSLSMQSGAPGIDNCIAMGFESYEGFQKQDT